MRELAQIWVDLGFELDKNRTMTIEKGVYIDEVANSITFDLQEGPVKEVGVNGCQVDALLRATQTILESFNKRFPCRENSLAITKLEEAQHWLSTRTANREKRGVEGTNQE